MAERFKAAGVNIQSLHILDRRAGQAVVALSALDREEVVALSALDREEVVALSALDREEARKLLDPESLV